MTGIMYSIFFDTSVMQVPVCPALPVRPDLSQAHTHIAQTPRVGGAGQGPMDGQARGTHVYECIYVYIF